MTKAKSFADKLKSERKRLNLTQDECASFLGVDLRTISGWENGAPPLPLTQFGALTKLENAKPVAAK